jgi:hypothetical protein
MQRRHTRRSNIATAPVMSLSRLVVVISHQISAWTKPQGNGATSAKPDRR